MPFARQYIIGPCDDWLLSICFLSQISQSAIWFATVST
jgi:hypothetical protein